ncbi:MAG: hypothetical protein AABX01_02550 [Candidatus Micrarchaeota archaeon]
MGDFFEDSFAAAKFGFEWTKDSENWKSYGLCVLAYLLVFGLIIAAIIAPLLGMLASFKSPLDPNFSVGYLVYLLAAMLTIIVLFWIVQMLIIGSVIANGLNKAGVAAKWPNLEKRKGAILVAIISGFKAFFMWYDKKWLFVLLLTIILPLINPLLMIISVMLFFAYGGASFFMNIRLSQSLFAYFASDTLTPSQAVDTSYALTRGYAVSLFARLFVSSLSIGIVFWLLTFIPWAIFSILDMIIGIGIFSNLLAAVVNPLQVFAALYSQAYIYSIVLQWNKERLALMDKFQPQKKANG